MVAKKETRNVNQILSITSGSFDVSNICVGLVAKNIPSSGLMIKSKISPPMSMNTISKLLSPVLYMVYCSLAEKYMALIPLIARSEKKSHAGNNLKIPLSFVSGLQTNSTSD